MISASGSAFLGLMSEPGPLTTVVWRATDTRLGRPVAVKVLKAEYADDAAFRDRILRESQLAAHLDRVRGGPADPPAHGGRLRGERGETSHRAGDPERRARVGVLDLEHTRRGFFTEEHQRTMTTLAAQIAIALENARLYADIAEQRREAQFLSDITRDLASSLDPALVLRKIIEYAKDCCGSDMAFIAPYDRAQQVATIVASVGIRTDVYIGVLRRKLEELRRVKEEQE